MFRCCRSLSACVFPSARRQPAHATVAASLPLTIEEAKANTDVHKFGLRLDGELCRIIKVYDGDSFTITWLDAASRKPMYANSRLYGIDAPELRSADHEEKVRAVNARDTVAQHFLGEVFSVTTCGPTGLDKYGRPLIVLRSVEGATGASASNLLAPYDGDLGKWILGNVAGCYAYFGGTKRASPPSR